MPIFKTNDGSGLYYETHGFEKSNPVVVFLNGVTQTTANWAFQVKHFKARFRVVTYDARAQGKSVIGSRGLSLENHARDLCELLDHLGVDKANLVGMSLGGRVALAMAADHPGRVERLVTCGVGARPAQSGVGIAMTWLETLRRDGLEAMVKSAIPSVFGAAFLREREMILNIISSAIVRQNHAEAVEAQLQAVPGLTNNAELAARCACPSLVITGDEDPMATPGEADELAGLLGGRREEIPGVGHSIPAEVPEMFNHMVLAFLTADRV
ncbi:MAG: alpha/beta fold hydrolase [Desulfobacterales bacterium]|nr:alpha/beta fold hydrolase [Desulfobacterales bacterium]